MFYEHKIVLSEGNPFNALGINLNKSDHNFNLNNAVIIKRGSIY